MCASDISLATIKTNSHRVDNLLYCLAWVADQKKGHPKKGQCLLGVTDHILNSGKKRKHHRRSVKFVEHDSELGAILEDYDLVNLDDLKLGHLPKDGNIGG